MNDAFRSVAGHARTELKVKGSRFVGEAFSVVDEDHAAERLAQVRKELFSATHHCFAYRLGVRGERSRSSDAGEPSGTAGQPILHQIEARSLTNTLVVVTRYFGGTMLGRGGLARAYGATAANVLDVIRTEEHFIHDEFELRFSYDDTARAMRTIEAFGGVILGSEYSRETHLTVAVRRSLSNDFEVTFVAKLGGRGSATRLEK